MNHSRSQRTRRRVWSLGAAALAVATAGLSTIPAVAVTTPAAAAPAAARATVTVDLSGRTTGTLPARFLGLSFESGGINSGQFDRVGNLPALLENLGLGVLRFGGNSVDRAAYHGVRPAALAGLARLVRATDWHVIYSVNFGHFSASGVTSDAKAVAGTLRGHLDTIACGNEPDAYAHNGLRPPTFTETSYLKEVASCLKAVRHGAPAARLSGPDTFSTSWLPPYAAAEKGTIGLLAEHFYPLNNCHGPSGTAATLLSAATAAKEAATVTASAAAARTAGVRLRMSETNSAACGGIPGVSNTYASALWAVDYLMIAAEHGASGVNFHGGLSSKCGGYTPLCEVAAGQYRAAPVYYGLLFTHLLGTGHVLPVTVSSAARVTAHAVETSSGAVRVVIENLTGTSASVSVRAHGASGTASVLHLTGPSLAATGGVRIQGRAVPADGMFAPDPPSHLRCQSGKCHIDMAADTAVIITLP